LKVAGVNDVKKKYDGNSMMRNAMHRDDVVAKKKSSSHGHMTTSQSVISSRHWRR